MPVPYPSKPVLRAGFSILLLLIGQTASYAQPTYPTRPNARANTADNNTYQWQVRGNLPIPGNQIRQIARDPNGTVWLADGDNQGPTAGLMRIAPDGTTILFGRGQNGVPVRKPTAITANNGTLWMLVNESNNGPIRLYKYDGRVWSS